MLVAESSQGSGCRAVGVRERRENRGPGRGENSTGRRRYIRLCAFGVSPSLKSWWPPRAYRDQGHVRWWRFPIRGGMVVWGAH